MPDWTYHTMFEPALSKLPAKTGREFIHNGMHRIASIPGGSKLIEYLGHTAPAKQLETKIFGLTIANPVGLSGKIDPLLSGTKAFGHLGMGFIEVGPVSWDPVEMGTPRFTDSKDAMVYPYRLESPGIKRTIEKLSKLESFDKPIFIRIGRNDTFEQTLSLLKTLSAFGQAFIVEELYGIKQWKTLKEAVNGKPILFAGSAGGIDSPAFVASQEAYIDGIVLDEQGVDTGQGMEYPLDQSGQLIEKLTSIRRHSKVPILVSGGIAEPKDALDLYEAGADLVMLTGGYVRTGPGLPKRINEGLLNQRTASPPVYDGWMWHWLFGLFMFLGGAAAMLVSMTIVLMPYDEAFLNLSREELMAINPNIYYFMQHDRMTVAGTMVSGGILYMQLTRYGVRHGLEWAKRAIHIAGVLGFLGILLFIGFGYFDWLHGILWLVLLPFFWKGYLVSKDYSEHSSSRNRKNHPAWKRSLLGQLAFVVLGSALAAAGFIISAIGVSGVFVQTDIAYICMNPEQISAINERLIPVIAHDRAGLGSALISVGLLVLMLALWGFQEGQRWVLYTFLLGGSPAFGAAILIHYVIGYTNFIHILPAYVALVLFVSGLWLSKKFFFM
ncbi:dihydroorotate dehydrogenase [Planococcus maritimus]|uniref:dihydroorotate dehydrogenase n=2 Tax=Planococcus maritimus TaxID=192421 RepID=UPI0007980EC0|nr:dihydroorotate dehydrogenase [Planococcus maritimus]KYG58699.1 dihydroorotate dehydrogenase [Planococcus maritimus]OED32401.1 dihydroorotate dehydrogenase [Planococcus maritimus]